MVSDGRRAEIRRWYRMRRTDLEKAQWQIESLARLEAGRYWKIENGLIFPTNDERTRLARVLKCDEAELPVDNTAQRMSA